jgi:CO/xanthine dehydrogenase Mo-binding subunit
MALTEESVMDGRLGRVVNGNLADYHVPVEADVPNLEVPWIGAPDERGARARELRSVARARRAFSRWAAPR